ncbi:MAG: NAD(P)-dependent oxidoreductase [bacterium]
MKILIVGAKGLLGNTMLLACQKAKLEVIGSDVSDPGGIDITSKDSINSFLEKTTPDVVINCAAYTKVEACETEAGYKIAKAVNADGPILLAKICQEKNVNFVHLSTDYVFGDNNPEGYPEDYAIFKPLNKYAETKLLAEKGIITLINNIRNAKCQMPNAFLYIIRTSWLFGLGAQNFIAKILEQAATKPELTVVTDEISSPTYVQDLAERIIYILQNNLASGIYHVSGLGKASRYDFAKEILRNAKINIPIKAAKLADYPRQATIPNISYLINTKLPAMRTWQEMVTAYFQDQT